MESHPHHQVFGTLGDRGGPLVLSTRRGTEVAGVYSYLGKEHLSSYFTGAPAGWFHCQ